MKKVILVLAVSAFAFSSCDKEKTCKCDLVANGNVVTTQEKTIDSGKCKDLNGEETYLLQKVELKCKKK